MRREDFTGRRGARELEIPRSAAQLQGLRRSEDQVLAGTFDCSFSIQLLIRKSLSKNPSRFLF